MDELLASRTKLRSRATKLCSDLRSYREGDRKALDPDQLALKLHHLKRLQSEMQGIQVELDSMGKADDTCHFQNTEDEVFLGNRLLTRLERAEEARDKAECHLPTAYTELKTALSLKIPTFQGDVMKWAEFWELFAIAVHDNPKFARVQKFVVLKSHLAGIALKSIQGIPVTADGYTQAVEALRERFELDDVRRETLLKELLNMPSVRHNDLKAMRSLIDHLMAHTRALGTLGVATESLSILLLPVAKEKLPEDWRLEWARRDSTNFDEFLRFLNQEIKIRESARGVTAPSVSNTLPMVPSVVSNLNSRRESRSVSSRPPQRTKSACVCGQGHQRLDHCERFRRMILDDRWNAAKETKACFRCLGSGHVAKDCKGQPCAECGRQHHSLLHNSGLAPRVPSVPGPELSPRAAPFSPKPPPNEGTRSETETNSLSCQNNHRYNVGVFDGSRSLFQTAVVEATGPKGSRKVRVLLDGGSDASYIRSSLAEELGLPVTDKGTFSCLGFQEKTEKPREYNKVQVDLKSRFGGCSITLNMWSTEQLCSPLPTAPPPQVPSDMEMADDFGDGDVELLIGIDNMYRIVLWEQLELSEGLRAVETVFGYVLHGRCGDTPESLHKHQRFHSYQVESMWDLDTVGTDVGRMTDRLSEGKKDHDDEQMAGMMKDAAAKPSHPELDQAHAETEESRSDETLSTKMSLHVIDSREGSCDPMLVPEPQRRGLSPTPSDQEAYQAHVKLSEHNSGSSPKVGSPTRVDDPRDVSHDPSPGPERRQGLLPASRGSESSCLSLHGIYRNRSSYKCWDPGGVALSSRVDPSRGCRVAMPGRRCG